MTQANFYARMKAICAKAKTLTALEALARALVEEELGANAWGYVDGIDLFARRARELTPRKEFGPPHKHTVGKPLESEDAL